MNDIDNKSVLKISYIGIVLLAIGVFLHTPSCYDNISLLSKLIPFAKENIIVMLITALVPLILVYNGYRYLLRDAGDFIKLSIVIFLISMITLQIYSYGVRSLERVDMRRRGGIESIYYNFDSSKLYMKDVGQGELTLNASLYLENLSDEDIPVYIFVRLDDRYNSMVLNDTIAINEEPFILKAGQVNEIHSDIGFRSRIKNDYGYINLDTGYTIFIGYEEDSIAFTKY